MVAFSDTIPVQVVVFVGSREQLRKRISEIVTQGMIDWGELDKEYEGFGEKGPDPVGVITEQLLEELFT